MNASDHALREIGSVGVIIVNWNSWHVLARCLEELQKQTYKNFSTVVIDNNSEEQAPIELLSLYPNVRFIRNDSNRGFAAANNQAISLLNDSEWLSLLNPDAFPEPEWLEMLVHAAENNPGYAMFASRQINEKYRHLLDGDGDSYHFSGLAWRKGHGMPRDDATHQVREVFSPCAAAALYRRDALISVGGFDEDFFCYFEDIDLGFRLRLMGHRCLLVPSAVVYHIGSATSGGQQSDFAVYHGHRNLVWAYFKNMPGLLFVACLPLHIVMNLVTILVFFMRKKGRPILRAKWDAIKGIPIMWRKRQQIQANRIVSEWEIWKILNKSLWSRMG